MAEILLRNKIELPPLRRPAVARRRLSEILNESLVEGSQFLRRLTLISAPAGYGKTTLAVEWLNELKCPIAWLSLDEGDNDPARFMSYFIAAFQTIWPEFGQTILAIVQAPQRPPAEVILTLLLNEMEAHPDPLILVLEDYHAINSLVIHQQLSFILEHLPPFIHVVLITREDPLIPIARLRARNQVCDIRQADLRFTVEETEEFMNRVMQLRLSDDEIMALERRTEGWIAGLQLTAITLHGMHDRGSFLREFRGSTRYILDYLTEEVVNRQPDHIRDFLMHTCILDRMCGPLCDAVTGESGGSELLARLEQGNLFIVPLDKSRTWYRYHHLFAELLRHQQQHSEVAFKTAVLHQRASQWYEAAGYMPDAIEHAIASQDWIRAAQLINQANETMLMQGQAVTLSGWFEKLPSEVIFARPEMCLTYGWVLLLTEKYDQAGKVLAQAERQAPPESVFSGQVATAEAYLARAVNNYPGVIAASQQALRLLPEGDLVSRSNLFMNLGLVYWHVGNLEEAEPALREAADKSRLCANLNAQLTSEIFLARTMASRGKLHEAEKRLLAIIQKASGVPSIALAYFDLSTLYYEWDQLDKAELYQQTGQDICRQTGNTEFQIAGEILQVYLALARQDWSAAFEAASQAWNKAQGFSKPTQKRCAAAQALVALRRGELNSAAQWLEISGEVDAHPFYRFLGLIKPDLLIAQGKLVEASEQLGRDDDRASQAGWGYALLRVRILQALAAVSPGAAFGNISAALHLAEPEGYLRTFIDAGLGITPLLERAVERGVARKYAEKLLAGMGSKRSLARIPDLAEQLSEREAEVLRLVTAGLSNREIARKLTISVGTAKTHVHNLYSKLGVVNRIQAARRAKELGLD